LAGLEAWEIMSIELAPKVPRKSKPGGHINPGEKIGKHNPDLF